MNEDLFGEEDSFDEMIKRIIEIDLRKEVEKICKLNSSAFMNQLITSAINRIRWNFEKNKFGVIAPLHKENKKDNYDSLFNLIMGLKKIKYNGMVHIGFWYGISDRCIFIPHIKREQLEKFAKDWKIDNYIWGEKKNWACYNISGNTIIVKDDSLKLLYIDSDFLIYSRIQVRKIDILQGKKKNIKDLEKIEQELLEK